MMRFTLLHCGLSDNSCECIPSTLQKHYTTLQCWCEGALLNGTGPNLLIASIYNRREKDGLKYCKYSTAVEGTRHRWDQTHLL